MIWIQAWFRLVPLGFSWLQDLVLTSFKSQMAIADSCLYAAKAAGKNSWVGVESAQDPALFGNEASLPQIESLLDNEQVVIRRAGGELAETNSTLA